MDGGYNGRGLSAHKKSANNEFAVIKQKGGLPAIQNLQYL